MRNELGLPEGRKGELCERMECPEALLYSAGGTDCARCEGLEETATFTLTELAEWKEAVEDARAKLATCSEMFDKTENALADACDREQKATARADRAETERDTAIKEVAKYAQAAGKAEAALKEARSVLTRCKELFDKALPKFNWGASFLNATAIALLNEVPIEVARALAEKGKKG